MKSRDILRAAREQGWRVEEKTSGFMLFPPNPEYSPVTFHESCVTAGSRSLPNLLSDLRRRGMIIPGEEQQRRNTTPMKVSEIVKLARQQDWRVEESGGGYKLYPADATQQVVTIGKHMDDNSSGRHYQNMLSQLRQAGLVLPSDKTTRKLESERHPVVNTASAPDPLEALQDELQIEEEVEITRTRLVKIWLPTLQKLLESYVSKQMPRADEAIYEIRLMMADTGNVPLAIEDVSYVEVKTVTVEKQVQGGSHSA